MKAILNEDIIVQLTMDRGTVEVGNIPSGVSLERMRWDGSQLVDLMTLRYIHVRVKENNFFELHCIPLKNTHPVAMSYKDRKKLRVGADGSPYIADEVVLKEEVKVEKLTAAEVKLCNRLGGSQAQFQSLQALVAALIVYASTGSPALKSFFDDLTPHIKDAYPLARYEQILKDAAKLLNQCMIDYHAEVDKINSE